MSKHHPFRSSEAAWFWAMATIEARRVPGLAGPGAGPCSVELVLRCLDTAYRRRGIELLHVRVLRAWGRRGRGPDARRAGERCDWRLWREAMEALDPVLRAEGVVVGGVPGMALPEGGA